MLIQNLEWWLLDFGNMTNVTSANKKWQVNMEFYSGTPHILSGQIDSLIISVKKKYNS